MTRIDRQLSAVQRRLALGTFIQTLVVLAVVAAAFWIGLVLADRLFSAPLPLSLNLAGVLTLATLIAAGAIAWMRRASRVHAALVIDQAAKLRERTTTYLALNAQDNDPFAQAARHDAEVAAGRIHVPSHLPLREPRHWPLAGTSVIAAVLVTMLLPEYNLLSAIAASRAEAAEVTVEERAVAEQVAAQTNQELESVKELLRRPELSDALAELPDLRIPNHSDQPLDETQREALAEIDQASEAIQQARRSAAIPQMEALRQQLARHGRQLSSIQGEQGTSELARSLAEGDFSSAREDVEQLKEILEELADKEQRDGLDDDDRQQLSNVGQALEDLAMKLDKLANTTGVRKTLEHEANLSQEQAEQLLEDLQRSGAAADPEQLLRELEKQLENSGLSQEQLQNLARKLAQQEQARQQAQQLAEQLQKAANATQQSDANNPQGSDGQNGAAGAAGALSNAAGQLSDLEMAQQLAQELSLQMNRLNDLKDQLTQGNPNPNSPPGSGGAEPREGGEPRMGEGRGFGGDVGKKRTAFKTNPVQDRGKQMPGKIIGKILIDGPQVAGEAAAEQVSGIVESRNREARDAIERDAVPRQYHRGLKQYWDTVAGLTRPQPDSAPAAPASEANTNAANDPNE